MDAQVWNLINRIAPRFGVDPRAAAAVAMMESGGNRFAVGDQGSSYGLWQLHQGGALPAGRGLDWAAGRGGIRYALSRMGQVASGLQGRAAIAAIVNRFERPADPGSEIAGAVARYGGLRGGGVGGGLGGGGGSGGAAALPGLARQSALAQQLWNFAQTGSVSTNATDPFAQMLASQVQSRTASNSAGGSGAAYSGPASGKAAQALQSAKAMIGKPYVWGGESPKAGFDCSGLVQWAFARAGIAVPRTSQQQIQHGKPVKWGSFHPGDLIFSNFDGGRDASHVVIYLGNGKVIAAPHTGANVQIEDVNAFKQNFVGARRYF